MITIVLSVVKRENRWRKFGENFIRDKKLKKLCVVWSNYVDIDVAKNYATVGK